MVTIDDVKRINQEKGFYFFSPDTMRFFRSKIETSGNLIGNKYFVTSEQFVPSSGAPDKRKYTIREFIEEKGDINTVGNFNELPTKKTAENIAQCMVEENKGYDECKSRFMTTIRVGGR